ncbi:hypothetical protein LAZ67_5004044 [Cordylochernes scorpioides]|uniref:Uncharacterized protein n=1 Tax=Cordylochernes scorpioides TaxID=51811 RepID=A0ABY6KKM3_9ARAC|nr:hypothetical protein LAZ67_5004044 [Cordylochernes scorpioides]
MNGRLKSEGAEYMGRSHLALVHKVTNVEGKDPFYEITGVVSLEDIIEEILQFEIIDETDVVTDNRKKQRREPYMRQDFSDFAKIGGGQKEAAVISPQMALATYQFLSTLSQESETAVHASYVLSEMIAKHSKPFTEGDFIKECLIKAAEIVCPGSVKTFQAISLSRNTVVERVTDMARNLNDQIKEKSSCFEAFSIACDESTDIGGVAQLAVFFFRACDTDFNIFEELLELVPMHGTTTGEDIFNCVYDILQKYNLPQSKLTSVATDGAPSMTGKTNGFVALLRKKLSEISDGSNIHHTHCIIHQEVLCTKVIIMENVLTPIKKFINFIRSRGLNQRQLSLFLTEFESEYSGLSYYTEVRWLSCSKVLKQIWDLKEEICQFLKTKNQDITLFSDQVWLQDFSFMVDITKHLSDLNLKLQGKDQIITNMCDQVNAFKCKLVLWEKQLKNEDLMHFPTCNMYKSSLGETASYQKYAEKFLSLRNEFETRFSDFKSLEGKFTLFYSIFSINIESVPNHMQMEVIDIQCDSDLKAKFIEVGVSEFYKYLPARFENTRKLAYGIMSMFGSTYRCEQLFSLMKRNKSPIRPRITDVHLGRDTHSVQLTRLMDLRKGPTPGIWKSCVCTHVRVSSKGFHVRNGLKLQAKSDFHQRCQTNFVQLLRCFVKRKRQCEIVRLLKVPQQTLSKAIHRFNEFGHEGDRAGRGRKRTANLHFLTDENTAGGNSSIGPLVSDGSASYSRTKSCSPSSRRTSTKTTGAGPLRLPARRPSSNTAKIRSRLCNGSGFSLVKRPPSFSWNRESNKSRSVSPRHSRGHRTPVAQQHFGDADWTFLQDS